MSTRSNLDQFLDPVAQCLTLEVAEKISQIELAPSIHSRLDELADKVDLGNLSEDERTEYEELIDGLDLLGILKAKARGIVDRRAAWWTRR